MDLREALYTTRAMRRVSDQPIPQEVQARILDAAIRAPTPSYTQGWRFLLLDDQAVMAELAPLYREAIENAWEVIHKERIAAARATPDDAEGQRFLRVKRSGDYGVDHFHEYPLMLVVFAKDDPSGASVYPAVWNAMLAARGEGIGTALTSALGVRAKETLEILGVPADEGWYFAACITFGYPTGRWGVAPRQPVEEVAFRNRWGQPLGFEVNGPLYP